MTNNAETIRGRCKTETNIEMRREGVMAKIDGVDEGDEAEEQEDEKNLMNGRNSGTERWCANTILASQVSRRRRNTR